MDISDSFGPSRIEVGMQRGLAISRDIEESNRQMRQAVEAAAAKKKAERDHDVAVMEEQTRLARESAEHARESAKLARESGTTAQRGLWVAVASLVVAVIAVIVAVLAIVLV
ncbi:hypothetical protein GS432_20030 [Rhodococcus hoagii]|uniref:hypothetical protein n=1 Tax=Rhodococcus hoagii TaxID=43767 RepID=UPI00111C2F34|nr:hypothetical protein [Prescottella equi]MBM4517533.1 hypothetical protein [Prescottella equi]NKV08552.1 hypothetical protein [Prescottella equi]NKV08632.1 hypothetical protein [Prescottella equi]